MVTWVRGTFKNITGTLEFDPEHPEKLRVQTAFPSNSLWTGETARDNHLRSPDFLNCEQCPTIEFVSNAVAIVGPTDYRVTGDLTIRGVKKPVVLAVRHLGTWDTPWWEDGVDKGPKLRAGFTARTQINRFDFGVSWQSDLPNGGIVVGAEIDITLDVEAILESR